MAGRENPPLNSQPGQQRLMRIALGVLCFALLVVTFKNWEFWSDMLSPQTAATDTSAPDAESTENPRTNAPPAAGPQSSEKRRRTKTENPAALTSSPVITATNRTVLPPLEIQVVSGNREQNVHTANRSIQVDLTPRQGSGSYGGDGITTSAGQRVTLSTDGAPTNGFVDGNALVARKVQPDYPMLAKQMKIQGAVVLEALIGSNGDIQQLRVLTGPTILAAAAREAVKQWHFKPYLAGGKAVETEARITVNFTISAD